MITELSDIRMHYTVQAPGYPALLSTRELCKQITRPEYVVMQDMTPLQG